MPQGYYEGNKGHQGNGKSGNCESGPVLLRPVGFEIMKAITVFIGKTCGYKRLSIELMYFTVEAVCDMCECSYEDRSHARFTPDYHHRADPYYEELWAKVVAHDKKEAKNERQKTKTGVS